MKALNEKKAHDREVAEVKKSSTVDYAVSSEDRRLSGSFESNRGRLPMPLAVAIASCIALVRIR